MVKMNSSRCVRGQGYASGSNYEGPEEAYLVKNGWAEVVNKPIAEKKEAPAKAKKTKKVAKKTAKKSAK